jgi:APA family basic amino acid/polyamine antiporter
MSIWSRKSIEILSAEAEGSGDEGARRLPRSLGILGLTAFGVGSTIGAGIFSLTGDVAANHAGPAVTISFLLASIGCFFSGLCYAEFAAMVPIAGSAYSYAYATLGEVVAWVIGCSLVLEWLLSASVVAISWSGYVTATLGDLGVTLPAVLTAAPVSIQHLQLTGAWINLPAVIVVLACMSMLLYGTRSSATVNTVIVVAKILALVAVIVVGAHYLNPANWHPFVPANTGEMGQFGWSGVAHGAATIFFAYIGFDGVSTLAEEAKNPQRTVPWSLFLSLAICTIVYVGVSLVITGLTSYRNLGVDDPLYFALSASHAPVGWLKAVVAVVAFFGLMSVILTSIVGQVRIFYAMSRDGLLPKAFGAVGKRKTPWIATLITGLVAALAAGLFRLDELGDLVSFGTLLAFSMVCAGVWIMRHLAPQARRPFRAPWVPLVPILGVACCLFLMYFLPHIIWKWVGIWIAVGLVTYALYGYRHSMLRASLARRNG